MARTDRRERLALDESYRYYKNLEKNGDTPDLYQLVKSFKTVSAGLKAAENGHFKLTRQLWKRIHQALFDKLLTTFPGYITVSDAEGKQLAARQDLPEEGLVQFNPDGCRRADDIFQMEIKHLYPATHYRLKKAWKNKGNRVLPEDFAGGQCGEDGCFLKPVVLGQEVLNEESEIGRNQAYRQWWDLYLQAYCAHDRGDKILIIKRMEELETVWGNLYY